MIPDWSLSYYRTYYWFIVICKASQAVKLGHAMFTP